MAKARLLVELQVRPEAADEFVEMFRREFIARSRKEPGCEIYELWADAAMPGRMTIVEVWTSQADLDRHSSQKWLGEWLPAIEAVEVIPTNVRTMLSVEE